MINKWLITGDIHGDFSRFKNYDKEVQQDPNTAVIILGDAGLNWDLGEGDKHLKNFLANKYKFTIYCVRGNHEARPQNIPNMRVEWDNNVGGEVYFQEQWPTIRYFKDYGIYTINNYRVGVIGGAYSVDKWYRLDRGAIWYEDEQLTEAERASAFYRFYGEEIDFMLTHTCPRSWEPTDLFLPSINQKSVDKTMENFLDQVRKEISHCIWLFGHYHRDRLERPYVEQFFKDTENIDDIYHRWQRWEQTGELDWWLDKSPNFYIGVE